MSRQGVNKVWVFEDPLKNANATMKHQCKFGDTTVIARFGDFFEPPSSPTEQVALMIPHYRDGALLQQYVSNYTKTAGNDNYYVPAEHPEIPASNVGNVAAAKQKHAEGRNPIQGVYILKSPLPGIPYVILFSYEEKKRDKWNELFQEVCNLLPSPDVVLRIPAIGTNNKVSFFDSAFAIFFGLRMYLRSATGTRKPNEIHVVTLFSDSTVATSTRTVLHIIRLMKMDEKEDNCNMCNSRKVDCILPCGHRMICMECFQNMAPNYRCPLDSMGFHKEDGKFAPIVQDYSKMVGDCCDVAKARAPQGRPYPKKIFVPCGCYRAVCENCIPKFPRVPEAGKEGTTCCHGCNKPYEAFWDLIEY